MYIEHVNCVRNLGDWFDSMLSMGTRINKVCRSGFYYLHNLRRIRKYLSKDCQVTLIHAFVTSLLDYCNGLMYGHPWCQNFKIAVNWGEIADNCSECRALLLALFST